jgi:hypothetical protein
MLKQILLLKSSGVPITTGSIIGMWMRKTLTDSMVGCLIAGHRSGVGWPVNELEALTLAGGDPSAVMRAAINLTAMGCDYDRPRLTAAHLGGLPVAAITEAYADLRIRYPELTFDELLTRAREGEDVLTAVESGSFLPQHLQDGWLVRLEVGPMTGHELSEFLAARSLPNSTMVWDPGRKAWIRVDEVSAASFPGGNA